MGERKGSSDPLWKHADVVDGKQKIRCKFCDKVITGGITRFRYHLAQVSGCDVSPCLDAPPEIKEEAFARSKAALARSEAKKKGKRASSSRSEIAPLNEDAGSANLVQKKKKKEADLAIVRMLEKNNFIYGMMTTVEFSDVCRAIADHGPGYEPPDIEMVGKIIYHKLKKGPEIDEYVKDVMKSCKSPSGCSLALVVNEYAYGDVNVGLVCSSLGAVALNASYNLSDDDDDMEVVLTRLLKEVGPRNVVHCVVDGYFEELEYYKESLEMMFPDLIFA